MTSAPQGRLGLDELTEARRGRARRHGPARDHRHAGAAAGKTHVRPALPRRHRLARRRGLQLSAGRRRRHEHRRRLRDVLVGQRLRRLRDAAGPVDAAPHPVAGGHGRWSSPTCSGTTARPYPRLRGRSSSVRRHGWPSGGGPRSSAPSSSSSSSGTPTRTRGARATAT